MLEEDRAHEEPVPHSMRASEFSSVPLPKPSHARGARLPGDSIRSATVYPSGHILYDCAVNSPLADVAHTRCKAGKTHRRPLSGTSVAFEGTGG